jgi:hypothetical protein
MRLVTAHTTQALTEDTDMNSRQRYKAKRAAEHRERKEYCQKIERAFSRLSEDCSNRVLRATSLGSLRDRQDDVVEIKPQRTWYKDSNPFGNKIHAVQKSRGKSTPLI